MERRCYTDTGRQASPTYLTAATTATIAAG